eukprot:TRINITY_DN15984_c0_g1_i1.p1 TRINITY_DN15984_c0_g1~~TRINITY_DN15984_c0_g1_i1.p1  ORF type:complete len:720 (-),score=166.62 TRINITY_DN15984_c0_g1_i1:168-2327(-)
MCSTGEREVYFVLVHEKHIELYLLGIGNRLVSDSLVSEYKVENQVVDCLVNEMFVFVLTVSGLVVFATGKTDKIWGFIRAPVAIYQENLNSFDSFSKCGSFIFLLPSRPEVSVSSLSFEFRELMCLKSLPLVLKLSKPEQIYSNLVSSLLPEDPKKIAVRRDVAITGHMILVSALRALTLDFRVAKVIGKIAAKMEAKFLLSKVEESYSRLGDIFMTMSRISQAAQLYARSSINPKEVMRKLQHEPGPLSTYLHHHLQNPPDRSIVILRKDTELVSMILAHFVEHQWYQFSQVFLRTSLFWSNYAPLEVLKYVDEIISIGAPDDDDEESFESFIPSVVDILLRGLLCIQLNRFEEAEMALEAVDIHSQVKVISLFEKNLRLFTMWKFRFSLVQYLIIYRFSDFMDVIASFFNRNDFNSEKLQEIMEVVKEVCSGAGIEDKSLLLNIFHNCCDVLSKESSLRKGEFQKLLRDLKFDLLIHYLELLVDSRTTERVSYSLDERSSIKAFCNGDRFGWLDLIPPFGDLSAGPPLSILRQISDVQKLFCSSVKICDELHFERLSQLVLQLFQRDSVAFCSLTVLHALELRDIEKGACLLCNDFPEAFLHFALSCSIEGDPETWKLLLRVASSNPTIHSALLMELAQDQGQWKRYSLNPLDVIFSTLSSKESEQLGSFFIQFLKQAVRRSLSISTMHDMLRLAEKQESTDDKLTAIRAQKALSFR